MCACVPLSLLSLPTVSKPQRSQRGEPVYCVAWSPSSDVVASGGGDDRAHIWRAGDTGAAAVLGAHQDSVSCVGFSHDGALLASGGMDGRVMVWNAQTGEAKVSSERKRHEERKEGRLGGRPVL